MFIVIEGLDGVGKTTIANLLATKLKGEFFPWLNPPYNAALPMIWENDQVSEASKHIAFLAAFKHMSDILESAAYRDKTVVADRYYFCPFAVHGPLAARARETALTLDAALLGLKKPDFAFYLALDEMTRRQRLAERGKSLSQVESLLEAYPEFNRQVRQNYENMAGSGGMTEIDIRGHSPVETIDAILREIR
jgi:dTMP kinase